MPVADGRGSGYGLVVACLGAILLLATGCGTGTPADWIKLVNAAGRLNAVKYGRASLAFTSGGGAVWIQVGLGPASA